MSLAVVQRKVSAAPGNPSSSNTTGALINTVTHNLIVVTIQAQLLFSGTSISSVTDTAGNSYVATPKSPFANTASNNQAIYYAKNITGNASNVVTVTFSGSTGYNCCAAYEVSGADQTAPFQNDQTGTAASGTTISTTANVTMGGNTCMIFFVSETDGGNVTNASYTIAAEDGSTFVYDGYLTTPSSTDQTPSFTAGNGKWGLIAASFKQAGSGSSFNPGWTYGATKIIGGAFQ